MCGLFWTPFTYTDEQDYIFNNKGRVLRTWLDVRNIIRWYAFAWLGQKKSSLPEIDNLNRDKPNRYIHFPHIDAFNNTYFKAQHL